MPTPRLHQTCTYWGSPVPSGYGGSSFALPQTLPCRWEDKAEEIVDSEGQTKLSRAVVYLSNDVEVGGYLYLGESSSADPTGVVGAFPIQRYSKMPDILAVNYLRKAWL